MLVQSRIKVCQTYLGLRYHSYKNTESINKLRACICRTKITGRSGRRRLFSAEGENKTKNKTKTDIPGTHINMEIIITIIVFKHWIEKKNVFR